MYTPHTFSIPELKGISKQTIDEHIKLYEGYVKNTNMILETIPTNNPYTTAELQRRLAFEFCGMRNHEYYFASLEGGTQPLAEESSLKQAIEKQWGSFDTWLSQFKNLAKTRGVGWAILVHDPKTNTLLNSWVDEQHLGHLISTTPILALDMWEHSFVADYKPSGKGQYIDDFFDNLNWNKIEENFSQTQ